MAERGRGRGRPKANTGNNAASSSGAGRANPEMAELRQMIQVLQQQVAQLAQQQALAPVVPSAPVAPVAPPPPPVVVPTVDRAEDGLLKQFLTLHAPTFLGVIDEDPNEFLREMDKRFRVMEYEGPRRVEMTEFVLRGSAQSWFDLIR